VQRNVRQVLLLGSPFPRRNIDRSRMAQCPTMVAWTLIEISSGTEGQKEVQQSYSVSRSCLVRKCQYIVEKLEESWSNVERQKALISNQLTNTADPATAGQILINGVRETTQGEDVQRIPCHSISGDQRLLIATVMNSTLTSPSRPF